MNPTGTETLMIVAATVTSTMTLICPLFCQTPSVDQKAPSRLVHGAEEKSEVGVRGLELWLDRHRTRKWGNLMNPIQECFDYSCLAPRKKLDTRHPNDCSLASPAPSSPFRPLDSLFFFVSLDLQLLGMMAHLNPAFPFHDSPPPPVLQAFRTSGALDSSRAIVIQGMC